MLNCLYFKKVTLAENYYLLKKILDVEFQITFSGFIKTFWEYRHKQFTGIVMLLRNRCTQYMYQNSLWCCHYLRIQTTLSFLNFKYQSINKVLPFLLNVEEDLHFVWKISTVLKGSIIHMIICNSLCFSCVLRTQIFRTFPPNVSLCWFSCSEERIKIPWLQKIWLLFWLFCI